MELIIDNKRVKDAIFKEVKERRSRLRQVRKNLKACKHCCRFYEEIMAFTDR